MKEKKPPCNLVDVQSVYPGIIVELKYATSDNIVGKPIYSCKRCFLQKKVALTLSSAQKTLEPLKLGLKIWDGYRPPSAHQKLWEALPDERFVSPPRKGSRHSRGAAVDVTLVTQEGNELLMPSGFDDFSEKASLHYQKTSDEALRNRDLLHKVMQHHGFLSYEWEWWHFDFHEWEGFPIIEWDPS